MAVISDHSKGLILGIIAAVFWGTYGTFINVLTSMGLQKMTMMAISPAMVVFYGYVKSLVNKNASLKVKAKVLMIMALHGFIVINGINYCYIRAIEYVPVGIVSVLSFCNVIIVMFASTIFFNYRINVQKIIAIIGALLGISLILNIFDTGIIFNLTGFGWAVAIPFLYGSSVILYKYYLLQGAGEEAILFWVNLTAAIMIWSVIPPVEIFFDIRHVISISTNVYGVFMALLGFFLIPLAGSYYAFFKAYEYIEPTYVSLCYALDPATATILGYILFDQYLSPIQLIGIIIVIVSILYIKLDERKEGTQ